MVKRDNQWWIEEADYIRSIFESRDFYDFDNRASCFKLYCSMQAIQSSVDGYQSIADYIERIHDNV